MRLLQMVRWAALQCAGASYKERKMVATPPLETLRPLTYDDLAALPDDARRYEIINFD